MARDDREVVPLACPGVPLGPWRGAEEGVARLVSEITSYSFRIYVTGETTRSWQAVANLHRLCEDQLAGRYEMEVVDVVERPELAEQER
ncbi:MAG: hypothetical protein E6G06_06110, partial [Actinobacteria bacterium]